jgi:GDP-mannose pyrophosphatase NudK
VYNEVLYFFKMETNVKNIQKKEIAKHWGSLISVNYEYLKEDGIWEKQTREVYDRGHGATILLYNPLKKTVILTRQFRIPTYLGGHPSGMFVEACAGKIDTTNTDEEIIREVKEETGFEITSVQRIFELFMSPGSISEKIYFYMAPISDELRTSPGGGVEKEQENIQVLEIPFQEALQMITQGEIADAKTVILLQYALINALF